MRARMSLIPKSWWFIGYGLGCTALLYFLFQNWAYDDPFITFRYAENLRQTWQFVYNPGERVLSTTTPLFAILLAILSNLWNDLPRLAVLIDCVSLALSGIFLWQLAEVWGTPAVGWAGLLLYPTFAFLLSTLGSEIPFYLALCLGALRFYAQRQYHLVATCAALAVLTRLDALVLVVILAGDFLIRVRGAIPWSAALLFIAILVPWFTFAWLYFGSPLPATLFAKQHQGSMSGGGGFVSRFLMVLQNYSGFYQYWFEGLLGCVGIFFATWRTRTALIFLVWAVLYFLAYILLGVGGYFWYYTPLVPPFLVMVGLGLSLLRSKRFNQKIALKITVGAVCLLSFAQINDLLNLRQDPDTRLAIYHDIGEWLRANTSADASVGTLEVGIIGYYSQRRMIDFAGLIQPDIASQLKPNTTYEDAALWATGVYHPNYLVLYDNYMPRLEQNYVMQHCVPAQRFSGEVYHFKADLSIYACSSVPETPN